MPILALLPILSICEKPDLLIASDPRAYKGPIGFQV